MKAILSRNLEQQIRMCQDGIKSIKAGGHRIPKKVGRQGTAGQWVQRRFFGLGGLRGVHGLVTGNATEKQKKDEETYDKFMVSHDISEEIKKELLQLPF
ncbi:MAG TPA: hypothetical protein IAC91_06435 [Candidatus Faecimorpha stercoravium]|nr:hypothetical protein [Candidatus Faecimorpha stercoravium]